MDRWPPRIVASLQRGGATPSALRTMFAAFSAAEYLAAGDDELGAAGCRRIRPVDGHDGDAEMVLCTDPAWPAWAERAPAPPAVLWVRGRLPPQGGVAIVGSRSMTALGERVAQAATAGAAAAGVAVWSGLARGVDSAAHHAALSRGVITHAVIGGGHGTLRPDQEALADAIVAAGGSVISEQAHGRKPDSGTLVARNRLIVAGADVLCVAEGEMRSGTARTVAYALRAGTPIVAPNPPVDPRAYPTAELVHFLCDARGVDARKLGLSVRDAERFDHVVPLANAACTDKESIVESVRILATFARTTDITGTDGHLHDEHPGRAEGQTAAAATS
jgi:DNA protecting protein DprA